MDDIKLFAKKELEFLIQTIRIYSQDIGMKFGTYNANNEKVGKRNNRRKRTVKSGKNLNTWRKGK